MKRVIPFESISKAAFLIPLILISLEVCLNNLCLMPNGGATISIKSLLKPISFAKLSAIWVWELIKPGINRKFWLFLEILITFSGSSFEMLIILPTSLISIETSFLSSKSSPIKANLLKILLFGI